MVLQSVQPWLMLVFKLSYFVKENWEGHICTEVLPSVRKMFSHYIKEEASVEPDRPFNTHDHSEIMSQLNDLFVMKNSFVNRGPRGPGRPSINTSKVPIVVNTSELDHYLHSKTVHKLCSLFFLWHSY
jgi:hypothetical protein